MSWYSKVAWSEGLFLRQHHFQQNDRYIERLLENRVRQLAPTPGVSRRSRSTATSPSRTSSRCGAPAASSRTARRSTCRAPARCRRRSTCRRASTSRSSGWCCRRRWSTAAKSTWPRAPPAAATSATSRRSSIRPPACMSSRRSRSRIRARPSRSARRRSRAANCLRGRPHPRSARQDHHLRRDLRAAGHRDAGASGRRRLDRARHRLDGYQAGDAVALRRRSELRRRPADLRLFHAADAEPRDQRGEAHARFAVRPSGRVLQGAAAHRRRAVDLLAEAARAANMRITTRIRSTRCSSRCCPTSSGCSASIIGRAIRLNLVEKGAERLRRGRSRPRAVPQRHLRGRGRGQQAAVAGPAAVPGALQGRSEHQDERDRADASARHRARPYADAAAPDPRGVRPRLFLSRQILARSGPNSASPAAWACISPAIGRGW